MCQQMQGRHALTVLQDAGDLFDSIPFGIQHEDLKRIAEVSNFFHKFIASVQRSVNKQQFGTGYGTIFFRNIRRNGLTGRVNRLRIGHGRRIDKRSCIIRSLLSRHLSRRG